MSEALTLNAPSPSRRGHGRRGDDQKHERLARLLSQVTEGIICLDNDWLITFANEEAFRRSRVKPEHINSKTFWEVYEDIPGTHVERVFRQVMETGVADSVQYLCPLGSFWLDVHVYPSDDGIALYYRDITARKQAEALRDTSVRQLEQVLEATTDGVVSLNRDWEFTFLNRRAIELLNVKDDLLGRKIGSEFSSVDLHSNYSLYAQRAMNERIAGEFEAYYPEPLDLWLSIEMRPSDDGIVIFFSDISERKKADEAIREQQEQLASIKQAALVNTWEIDLASGVVTVGAGSYLAAEHPMSGIPDMESFLKLVDPAHVPLIHEAIQKTIATGESAVLDTRLLLPDIDEPMWIESRGRAVVEKGRHILRGLSIDISARKKNEEALVASEARYRVLAELNPNAIWMGNSDGQTTYANQVLLDFVGLTMETIACEGLIKTFHVDDRQRASDAWIQAVSTSSDYDVEVRVMNSQTGRPRWWWMRASPIRDEAGNILYWLGVGIDIDDRKTFADALQQRQEQTERQRAELESIYQTAPIGLALFDPVEFRYLRVNDRQVETIGLPREKILGHSILEVAPLKGIRELFEQVARGHSIKNHVLEGELPARPGELRTWNVSYSPVRNATGKVEAIAAIVQEITHQKKAEAALIQNEKLAAVGRLASSISHEINNPLEAITNLLYLISLSGDQLPQGVRNYVQMAQSELFRVCQIATQTLRFHRQAVRATSVTAQELVDSVLNLYQSRLSNSGIHVDAVYATNAHVFCFENDIRQVLNNLISNAIDAMRRGGKLMIRAHDATDHSSGFPPARTGIRITIADNGVGMTPAVRARIFEPFYTTKDLNGTGLGLWISNGIVTRHQGRLTFRSSQNPRYHGTVFSLFLPWAEVPLPDSPTTPQL